MVYASVCARHIDDYAVMMFISFAALGLLSILSLCFVYWELDASCIRIHRFWSVREIAWGNVTQIVNLHPDYAPSNYLEIHYIRSALKSNQGSIIANPKDRPQFLAALRQFAPQAKFDV
ncbi:MAG: hypothetical protein ABSD44_15220 [Terracidiphilus sp.]